MTRYFRMDAKRYLQYSEIGARLRACRKALHLTQEQLAERADISPAFVGHVERAEKVPSVETLTRLCVCMGVSMDYLVMGKRQSCDKQTCALYEDLKRILAAYTSDQREFSAR